MDTHSSHLTAPLRSRSSQSPSPSHSASASATSSLHKRKQDHAPPFPSSFSDTRDGALTSNDDLESISARGGADSDDSEEFDDAVDDDEEEYDDSSIRNFTNSRLENNVGGGGGGSGRNTKMKTENSVKVEPVEVGKDGSVAAANTVTIQGSVVKEDTVKSIFTENLQTSGAYCAREESLKKEVV